MKTLIIIILVGIICFCAPEYFRNIYKVIYYETTLKNNRASFSINRFKNIVRVMNDKWIFIKWQK